MPEAAAAADGAALRGWGKTGPAAKAEAGVPVRRFVLWRVVLQGDARGRRSRRRSSAESVGENRTRGELRGVRRAQADTRLVKPVPGGEQVVDGPSLEARMEHPVAGLQNRFVIQAVRKPQARRQVLRR